MGPRPPTRSTVLTLRITLLGPPDIRVDGHPLVVDTRKAVALLAYVAVVERPVARDSLAELLWPDAEPDSGRGSLRRTLSVLRSGLGGRWLAVDRRQVALEGADIELDVSIVRAAIHAASHEHGDGDACSECRHALERGVAFARGEFLEGFGLRDSASFDEWQSLEAEALRGELGGALMRLVPLESAEGRWAEAIAAGRRLVALDRLDERAHRALMRVHAGAGDPRAAERQYEDCVRVLDAELGVAPEPQTTDLYRDISSVRPGSRPTTTAPAAPASPLARLDPIARDVLAASAILGDDVDPDLAAAVSGHDETALAAAIDVLVDRGVLLEPPRIQPQGHYRLADQGVRIAVLDELGLARRRALHRRTAAVLEARFDPAATDGVTAARIGEHLAAGARPTEAARFYRLAAAAARRISDHALVVDHLRSALMLGDPGQAELYAAIGDAETLRGRYAEALAAYERGAALANTEAVASFERRLGSLHLRRGSLELADLHLAAALARLGPAPSALRARVMTESCLVALRRGDEPASRRLAAEALAVARAIADAGSEAQAENLLAMLARRGGDGDAARRHLRRSIERAGLADDPSGHVAALNNLALLERAAGNLGSALELTDDALRRCVLIGDRHREAALRNNRADLLHALGRQREAAEELVRSVTAFGEVGDRQGFEPEIWKLVDW